MNKKLEIHEVILFDNGYGLSIIRNEHSYGGRNGLFEAALLHNGRLAYDEKLGFSDVRGWLGWDELAILIETVKRFPPREEGDVPSDTIIFAVPSASATF